MNKLAIIGGSGLTQMSGLTIREEIDVDTNWSKPSASISCGEFQQKEILFLPRHGNPHVIPPHKINYRANMSALHQLGVTHIVAINTVGGITAGMTPCRIVIPNQLIDYTHGRINTYYEDNPEELVHIDFTYPYSRTLREQLIASAEKEGIEIVNSGTYAVTQGPRLESAAEVKRLEKDGCDIVGMTSMPEASLARELDIEYACCALVVNWAAGKSDDIITIEILEQNLGDGMAEILNLLGAFLEAFPCS